MEHEALLHRLDSIQDFPRQPAIQVLVQCFLEVVRGAARVPVAERFILMRLRRVRASRAPVYSLSQNTVNKSTKFMERIVASHK